MEAPSIALPSWGIARANEHLAELHTHLDSWLSIGAGTSSALGSGRLPFVVQPLLNEVRASDHRKFMALASHQVEEHGPVQFNYVLQIDQSPQTALGGRADDLVQMSKMTLEQLSGYSNGDYGTGCA